MRHKLEYSNNVKWRHGSKEIIKIPWRMIDSIQNCQWKYSDGEYTTIYLKKYKDDFGVKCEEAIEIYNQDIDIVADENYVTINVYLDNIQSFMYVVNGKATNNLHSSNVYDRLKKVDEYV